MVPVETAIARLRFRGDYLRRVTERFHYPRDPLDAKFIELAIAGRATHLITHDADLLDLPHGRDDAAKRFRQRLPNLEVIDSMEFNRHRKYE
jgi:predicted nucleic acid-binding protein